MQKRYVFAWCVLALTVHCWSFCEEAGPYPRVSRDAFEARLPFFAYDKDIPVDGRIVLQKEEAHSIRYKLVFRGVQGFLVPGYLEIPESATKPYPLVVLLHGWSGGKDNWWEKKNYISGSEMRTALLKSGYAVLAFDAAAHGERSNEIDYLHVNTYEDPAAPPRRNYFSIPEIVIQTVKDCRRALDYMEERGDIDMSRVGLVGYSMGGVNTMLLLAIEPRIKMGVACVPPWYNAAWKPVEPVDYTWGLGDKPLLMLLGRMDEFYTEGQIEASRKAYLNLDTTKTIWYDTDHQLTPRYVHDALAWVKRYL
ncbi:MAG TPA: alpha/beta fold hydrolase [Candidatus Hydrogenedentes bacterium]|nr:alpha/beta fold hydrolase [Candidatus Hydrogenedentota bacterium]HQE84636.1 alpha/beta fold hydrolase [Candidatus Hydrogenedentota bacterium]HQH51730.1 alpha/beta fold hydrolase [Candidatus Hydrogenedentota bacterium]HQM50407.1 alpha/beta fold hydrolase [Candidatus Hydrogenedentota bacterium]